MQYVWAIGNTAVLYALAGVSFAVAYLASRRFNLAHGLVYSFAGYGAVITANARFSLVTLVAVGAVVGVLAALVIHAVPRPNLASFRNRQLLYSFGELLLGETLLSIIFGDAVRTPRFLPAATQQVASADVAVHELHFVIIGLSVLIACEIFLRTPFGLQLRAVCDSTERARVSGLPVRRMRLTLLIISGLCGGCAAVGWAIRFSIEPASGLLTLIPSITVALAAISLYEFAVLPLHFVSTALMLTGFTTLAAMLTSWRWHNVALSVGLLLAVGFHSHRRRVRYSDTQALL